MHSAVSSAPSAPYVGMRGGEQYYVLVRKTEPKPLRIFMQDGVHDEWPGGPEMGDWWMSNQTMNRALEFAGYDVRHIWGAGTHNGSQASAVFSRCDALALERLAGAHPGGRTRQSCTQVDSAARRSLAGRSRRLRGDHAGGRPPKDRFSIRAAGVPSHCRQPGAPMHCVGQLGEAAGFALCSRWPALRSPGRGRGQGRRKRPAGFDRSARASTFVI